MVKNSYNIGLDSNCFTYLISALENTEEPEKDDADREEKIALVQIFFYLSPAFWLSPAVISEYEEISDKKWLEMHQSWRNTHFSSFNPVPDISKVADLQEKLATFHGGKKNKKDCKIIAEYRFYANNAIDTVLSYDTKLLNHLSDKVAPLKITKPSIYWQELCIPKGSRSKVIPTDDNPLSNQSWWKW